MRREPGPRRATAPLLKDLNERTALEAIRAGAPISRAEISRRVGISKPTVSLALQSLLDAGLVREATHDPAGPSYGAVFFEPVDEAALVLGIDVGARFLRGALCDLGGGVRARHDVEGADAQTRARGRRRAARHPGGRRGPARRPHRRRRGGRPGRRRGADRPRAPRRQRSRDGGPRLRRRARGAPRRPRPDRQRHQPGGARRAVAGRGARRRRLRLPLDRHRPRGRAGAPRRAARAGATAPPASSTSWRPAPAWTSIRAPRRCRPWRPGWRGLRAPSPR